MLTFAILLDRALCGGGRTGSETWSVWVCIPSGRCRRSAQRSGEFDGRKGDSSKRASVPALIYSVHLALQEALKRCELAIIGPTHFAWLVDAIKMSIGN